MSLCDVDPRSAYVPAVGVMDGGASGVADAPIIQLRAGLASWVWDRACSWVRSAGFAAAGSACCLLRGGR